MRRVIWIAAVIMLAAFTGSAGAALQAQDVDYRQGDTQLKGHLAYDDSFSGKRPGVLVVHEWWGLNDYAKKRAEQLAELGYVALALDMYGEGKSTEHPSEAGEMATAVRKDPETARARFMAAMKLLQQDPRVDAQRIAAIGYCFGGATVLEMARAGVDLKGVVSFHGTLAPMTPGRADDIKAEILVCHGADDELVPPQSVAAFQEEMRDAKANWQMNIYGGAKHSFTNPQAGSHGMPQLAYNEQADRRSWAAMKAFLREVFGEQ